LLIATFARVDPSMKKSALQRAACWSKGRTEVLAHELVTTATKLKLAKRRRGGRGFREAIQSFNRLTQDSVGFR